MSESDKVFAGSIPQIYDKYLVPLIFTGFAEDVAQRVATLSPMTILETAAGSGVVTRSLATKIAPDARYVVTDSISPCLTMRRNAKVRTPGSGGSRRTRLPCRSTMPLSMSSAASLE